MKKGNAILIGLGIAVAGTGIYYGRKYLAAQKLSAKPDLPEQVRISGGKLTFLQPIIITNPSNTDINVNVISFDIEARNVSLGDAFLNQGVTINAREKTVLKVPIEISLAILLPIIGLNLIDFLRSGQNIKQYIKGKRIAIQYTGYVQADLIQVPIEDSITFDFEKYL